MRRGGSVDAVAVAVEQSACRPVHRSNPTATATGLGEPKTSVATTLWGVCRLCAHFDAPEQDTGGSNDSAVLIGKRKELHVISNQ